MITGGIDFVVCTRNNRAIIEPTLEAIYQQGIPKFTLTVVDGLSSDGTPEFIRSAFPEANVIVKDRDSGPAASRNIGIARAKSDWIVLVDSDVRLAPGWAERQQRFMIERGVDIACGKLVYASRPQVVNAAYGAMNRYGIAWDIGVGAPRHSHSEPRRCLWAGTSAVMIRRAAAEAIGAFDEAMFVIHEDCDFGWRANLMGYRFEYNPDALAEHNVHGTLSGNARMTYFLYRNRLRSVLINYEFRNILRYVVPYVFGAGADAFVRAPRRAKMKALAWNVGNFPDTLRRRSEVQARRKVSDHDLWPLFEGGFRGPGYAKYNEEAQVPA